MAQTTVITDDLDGSTNAETIEFTFAGTQYSIDLSKKNRMAFEKALRPYLAAATKVSNRRGSTGSTSRRSRRSASAGSATGVDLGEVRAWAAEQGIEVSNRGRVAKDVIDAYTAAQ